jgi:hypothetical protein
MATGNVQKDENDLNTSVEQSDQYLVALGETIESLLKKRKLSRRDLASTLGCGPTTLDAFIDGTRLMHRKYVPKLREYLAKNSVGDRDELNEKLAAAYLQEQTTSHPDLIKRRLTPESPFVEDLLKVPSHRRDTRTTARLLGATLGTLKWLELVTQGLNGKMTPEFWNVNSVLEAIQSSIADNGLVVFTHKPPLTAFAMGGTRGEIHHRIVVVMERCIYDWYDTQDRTQEKESLHDKKFLDRLAVLEAEKRLSSEARSMIEEFKHYVSIYLGSKDIDTQINNKFRRSPRTLSLEQLFDKVSIKGAECTAIVYCVDTAASYEEEPSQVIYERDFIITAKSLYWVAEFQRHLLPPDDQNS